MTQCEAVLEFMRIYGDHAERRIQYGYIPAGIKDQRPEA